MSLSIRSIPYKTWAAFCGARAKGKTNTMTPVSPAPSFITTAEERVLGSLLATESNHRATLAYGPDTGVRISISKPLALDQLRAAKDFLGQMPDVILNLAGSEPREEEVVVYNKPGAVGLAFLKPYAFLFGRPAELLPVGKRKPNAFDNPACENIMTARRQVRGLTTAEAVLNYVAGALEDNRALPHAMLLIRRAESPSMLRPIFFWSTHPELARQEIVNFFGQKEEGKSKLPTFLHGVLEPSLEFIPELQPGLFPVQLSLIYLDKKRRN